MVCKIKSLFLIVSVIAIVGIGLFSIALSNWTIPHLLIPYLYSGKFMNIMYDIPQQKYNSKRTWKCFVFDSLFCI